MQMLVINEMGPKITQRVTDNKALCALVSSKK